MMNHISNPFIAIGNRLKGIPEVLTIGLKPNYQDYSTEHQKLIQEAPLILYPTLNYAQFFTTMGKNIFPSLETYLYADEKIKQTTLFNLLKIPHPFTKFYYSRHHQDILNDFVFPFIAKIPRASSQGQGVFKIDNHNQLDKYLKLTKVAYIQEYLPHERDLRVVVVNYQGILAYWRKKPPHDFRTNLSLGGKLDFTHVPEEPVLMAQETARQCRFNDVGLDLIFSNDRWFVIEANMLYGHHGLKMKGLNFKEILRAKLLAGELVALETD